MKKKSVKPKKQKVGETCDASGRPYSRVITDLLSRNDDAVESWRVFRIMSEFVSGFELLRKHGRAATFFGSARFDPKNSYYQAAEELAARLAKNDFTIITGGGPGIMEAANVGGFKVGGQSIGINIQLPHEQKLNPYTTESLNFNFFFSRKVMLALASKVYIYFPGGFGTMDEFFEMATLVQTKKIEPIPIILYGSDYWAPLLDFMRDIMIGKYGTLSEEELSIFKLVDSVDEAHAEIIKEVDCIEEN